MRHAALLILLVLPGAAAAQAPPAGTPREANGGSGSPSLSADGNRLAFDSDATNLVRADTNRETTDPFVRDFPSNFTIVGDRARRGQLAKNGGRYRRGPGYAISASGQFIAFSSSSRDLGPGGGNTDIWRRDLSTGQTVLVSAAPGGSDDDSEAPAISADGQVVVFESRATNLVSEGDDNDHTDVYWRNLATGETRRISTPPPGRDRRGEAGSALNPVVSADGTWVAYTYDSNNLVAGPSASASVYRTNAATGVTEPVDVNPPPVLPVGSTQVQPAPQGGGEHPSISADGRFVMFDSDAIDLTPAANGPGVDVFMKDMDQGGVTLVSRNPDGSVGAGDSAAGQLSPDAHFAVFTSGEQKAGNDQNGSSDVYLRDLQAGVTALVSTGADGLAGEGPSINPAISGDGRFAAFLTRASKITGRPAGPYRPVRRDLATGAYAVANTGIDLPPRTLIGAPTGSAPRRRLRTFEGTAADDFLVKRVELAISRRSKGRCLFFAGKRRFKRRPCSKPLWVRTRLRSHLRFSLGTGGILPRGGYQLRSRAVDDRGQVEKRKNKGRNQLFFSLL